MPSLDTNVLVRFLVEDDLAQLASARKLIRAALRDGQALFVPITVALELEWVLRSRFGFSKPEIALALAGLLSAAELTLESETAIEIALASWQGGGADFSDCVHTALAVVAGQPPFWTFDKAAAKLEGARLVPA